MDFESYDKPVYHTTPVYHNIPYTLYSNNLEREKKSVLEHFEVHTISLSPPPLSLPFWPVQCWVTPVFFCHLPGVCSIDRWGKGGVRDILWMSSFTSSYTIYIVLNLNTGFKQSARIVPRSFFSPRLYSYYHYSLTRKHVISGYLYWNYWRSMLNFCQTSHYFLAERSTSAINSTHLKYNVQ